METSLLSCRALAFGIYDADTSQRQLGPAGCSRIRTGRLLLYAAHSGFGNQEMQLRKALLLAYVLNRTLVLPPLLPQSELSFGPPEQHCTDREWLDAMQLRAEAAYERRLLHDKMARRVARYVGLVVARRRRFKFAQKLQAKCEQAFQLT